MSGGTVCSCPEARKPIKDRAWMVTARMQNSSAFNGGRRTYSQYSAVRCTACNMCWRTKAGYVMYLPDSPPGWWKG